MPMVTGEFGANPSPLSVSVRGAEPDAGPRWSGPSPVGSVAGSCGAAGVAVTGSLVSVAPVADVAVTVTVYAVPLTRSVMSQPVAPAPAVQVWAPGWAVATYPVTVPVGAAQPT